MKAITRISLYRGSRLDNISNSINSLYIESYRKL